MPALLATAALAVGGVSSPASAATPSPSPSPSTSPTPTTTAAPADRSAVATGRGGAVVTVDPDASRVGLEVLRKGGNAVDAAIATAAALGVTEPYSSGIGGGGFLVYREARTGKVVTIDGRETAPSTFSRDVFTDGAGKALDFATVVSSGLSVGVPGTPALWDAAARRYGTRPLGELLAPAEQLASSGFVVDSTFAAQTTANADRFRKFPETARVYLPGGNVPAVGSTFRNPDLAKAYQLLRRQGVDALYRGDLGKAVVAAARAPRTAAGVTVLPGRITATDLRAYRPLVKAPTRSSYRGLDVYGMPVPSSGGITVGEALNLLEAYDRLTGTPLADVDDVQYLHRLAEASATAFADRNRHVGDVSGVPTAHLLSQPYADARACGHFDADKAQVRPIPFGDPWRDRGCDRIPDGYAGAVDDKGTTHLTVTDRWGNVASYTLTIEQTGGSGITVPGFGFLLNNELTDFNFVPLTAGVPDPNLPGPGKRPRSSMSPTIVLKDGRPYLALGSPGGATIITTVLQVLTERVDRGRSLSDAIAAPRLSSRNGKAEDAEPGVLDGPAGPELTALGHVLAANPEIGAAAAIEFLPDGRVTAAAEPTRRGGGAALVVKPD